MLAPLPPRCKTGLSIPAWRALRALRRYANDIDGWAWPHQHRMAEDQAVSRRTILRGLAELEAAELIQVDRTSRANAYRVVCLMREHPAHQKINLTNSEFSGRRRARRAPQSVTQPAPCAPMCVLNEGSETIPEPSGATPVADSPERTDPSTANTPPVDSPPRPASAGTSTAAATHEHPPALVASTPPASVDRAGKTRHERREESSREAAPTRIEPPTPIMPIVHQREDLRSLEYLRSYTETLKISGKIADCGDAIEWVVAAAEHALRHGKNPAALFEWTVKRDHFRKITAPDLQRARARIKADETRRRSEADAGRLNWAAQRTAQRSAVVAGIIAQARNTYHAVTLLRRAMTDEQILAACGTADQEAELVRAMAEMGPKTSGRLDRDPGGANRLT